MPYYINFFDVGSENVEVRLIAFCESSLGMDG